jgi:hypothetical protein
MAFLRSLLTSFNAVAEPQTEGAAQSDHESGLSLDPKKMQGRLTTPDEQALMRLVENFKHETTAPITVILPVSPFS